MRILFVCSENRLRSPTAAAVFAGYPGIETASAGTNPGAANPVSRELIEWADAILVMEQMHRSRICERFRDIVDENRIAVLDIPDHFAYMDPLLVQILKHRVPRYVCI